MFSQVEPWQGCTKWAWGQLSQTMHQTSEVRENWKHLEKLIPLNFETHVYLEGNLIRVFLIHLHSTHQNVILKELFQFFMQKIWWILVIRFVKTLIKCHWVKKLYLAPNRVWRKQYGSKIAPSHPEFGSMVYAFCCVIHKWWRVCHLSLVLPLPPPISVSKGFQVDYNTQSRMK